MISVHFNGEIVRHRNMKVIAARTIERFDSENRCKYGTDETMCQAWLKHCRDDKKIQPISKYGRCTLPGCETCPQYKKRIKQGNKKKTYTIDWKKYRQLASAAHYLLKESPNKTLFLTLTFPAWKKKHKFTKSFYYDEISNVKISNFLENLRTNYGCSGYIAVKEYGETTKRVHFHLIISYPFIDFRLFNNIWVNSISDICEYSACAIRHKSGVPVIIRNPARAIRYVCKYIGKSYGITSDTRIIFISRNILSSKIEEKKFIWNYSKQEYEHVTETRRISNIKYSIPEKEYNHVDYLKKFKSIYINTFDHVTVFKITDRREFNRLCSEFLYPLFSCSVKPSEFCYCPSEKPG
jgi:hypothetical protein